MTLSLLQQIELLKKLIPVDRLEKILIDQLEQKSKELLQQNQALVEARQAAEYANREKSSFLATVSHEIRTPLNAVVGMTGLLLETALNPQQREFTTIIRTSSNTLLSIIDDILDFSKIESGKLELELNPFNLQHCVEECLDLVASKATEKKLELGYFIDSSIAETLIGDVKRLRQILTNLLSNAVKFTDTGGITVKITPVRPLSSDTQAASPYALLFAVKDTGIGIPSDSLDRIFQAFSQADPSISRKYGGTGLGLIISQRLCQLMGGRLWVESELNRGSTFYFSIATQAVLTPQDSIEQQFAGKQLLILHHHESHRDILTLQARAWGMIPEAAHSASQALELLNDRRFDLVILDIQISEMSGLELVNKIREDYQDLPILVLTPFDNPQIIDQLSSIKFVAALNKPIKQSQLYNALTQSWTRSINRADHFISSSISPKIAEQFPLRILLAEDHLVNQKMALLILKRMGYQAEVAANGVEVLSALRRQSYDVILMDIQMPEMDGLAATRQICQEWEPHQRPRIIAMTANAMQSDRQSCMEAGMDDYLSKPIQIDLLVQALRRCQPIFDVTPARLDPDSIQAIHQIAGTSLSTFLPELINCYFLETPKLIQTMHSALASQDDSDLRRVAHTLQSSSSALGATDLSRFCRELEQSAIAKEFAIAATQVESIQSEYLRVQAALKLEISKLQ